MADIMHQIYNEEAHRCGLNCSWGMLHIFSPIYGILCRFAGDVFVYVRGEHIVLWSCA